MSPGDPQVEPDSEALDAMTIERGAVRGASVLITRSVVLQLVTGGATIILAHLLSPSDYGAFSIALAVQMFGRAAVEIGLPVALVRRPAPPSEREERALTGLLLSGGGAAAAVGLLIAFLILPAAGVEGSVPKLTAVACSALPLFALRAVPAVLLERRLGYQRIVVIEVAETVAFYAFAVPAAISGLGAWSLVGAVPVAAAVGVVAALLVQRWRFGISLDLAAIRPMLGFGIQAGALYPIDLMREVAVVSSLAAFGGQPLAGFYAMSQRVLSIPKAIQSAIGRVALPALARGEAGADRGRQAMRAIGATAVAVALPIATIAGAADPLIATIFGHRWLPTGTIVLLAAPGILLGTSIGSILGSLALADGDARSPLIALTAGGATSVLIAAGLASSLGTTAAGIATSAGVIVMTSILVARASSDRRGCVVVGARIVTIAGGAVLAGQLMPGHNDAVGAAVALLASGVAWLGLSALLARSDLALLLRLLRRHAIPGRNAEQVSTEATEASRT